MRLPLVRKKRERCYNEDMISVCQETAPTGIEGGLQDDGRSCKKLGIEKISQRDEMCTKSGKQRMDSHGNYVSRSGRRARLRPVLLGLVAEREEVGDGHGGGEERRPGVHGVLDDTIHGGTQSFDAESSLHLEVSDGLLEDPSQQCSLISQSFSEDYIPSRSLDSCDGSEGNEELDMQLEL